MICWVLNNSVVSDSLQHYGLKSVRLLYSWDFLGKKTGVSCHFLLQGNLPDPEIEPVSLGSPALAGGFFTTLPPGKPNTSFQTCQF